jgi:putative transposase
MHKPSPHSSALRKGRVSEANRAYLITSVCENRMPWFADLYLGRLLVRAFMGARPHAETLAFMVMPDHFHWLMQLGEERELSAVVQGVKSVSSHRINRRLGRQGSIWQDDGYHDHGVRSDEDLLVLARYVIANPLRAGLVRRIGDYPLWDAVWL